MSGKYDHHWLVAPQNGYLSEATCEKGCGETAWFRNSDEFDSFGNRLPPTPQLDVNEKNSDPPAEFNVPPFKDPRTIRGKRVA